MLHSAQRLLHGSCRGMLCGGTVLNYCVWSQKTLCSLTHVPCTLTALGPTLRRRRSFVQSNCLWIAVLRVLCSTGVACAIMPCSGCHKPLRVRPCGEECRVRAISFIKLNRLERVLNRTSCCASSGRQPGHAQPSAHAAEHPKAVHGDTRTGTTLHCLATERLARAHPTS